MRNSYAKKIIDLKDQSVTWNWSDGSSDQIHLSDFPTDIITRLALHGLAQKGGDSYSSVNTLAEAQKAFKNTLLALRDGEWNLKGEGRTSYLVRAISRLTERSIAEVMETVSRLSKADKRKLEKDPKVAKAILEIKREELEGTEIPEDDGDSLIDGLF